MFKNIITHRGINIDVNNREFSFSLESNPNTFLEQLKLGFSLEIDIQILKDDNFIISHDTNLSRITNNIYFNDYSDLTMNDLVSKNLIGNKVCTLNFILDAILNYENQKIFIHFKKKLQTKKALIKFSNLISRYPNYLINKIILFDLIPSSAKFLRDIFPNISMAPSISHQYDIERYSSKVGNTLMSLEEFIIYNSLYNWVWLDEWDRLGKDNKMKCFINEDNISVFKKLNMKIAVVSPELHSTSPGLVGGENHEDARNFESLQNIWKKWSNFGIDSICTDYGSILKNLN